MFAKGEVLYPIIFSTDVLLIKNPILLLTDVTLQSALVNSYLINY